MNTSTTTRRAALAGAGLLLAATAMTLTAHAATAAKGPSPQPAGVITSIVNYGSVASDDTPGSCRVNYGWTTDHPELVDEYVWARESTRPFKGKTKVQISSDLAGSYVNWPNGTTMYLAVSATFTDGTTAPWFYGALDIGC